MPRITAATVAAPHAMTRPIGYHNMSLGPPSVGWASGRASNTR